jgi:hypothetical protein
VAAVDFLAGDILDQLHACPLRSLDVSECIALCWLQSVEVYELDEEVADESAHRTTRGLPVL